MTFEELHRIIKNTIHKIDEFQMKELNTRNIILMGRARTGKSTVARTLQDTSYVPNRTLSLYSETKKIEFHPVATPIPRNGPLFNFNIIDTPGFYDQTEKIGQRLTNEYTTHLIEECMKKDMTNIHCFAFVFNLHNGINNEDIESMLHVQKTYASVKKHMILLLTHSEETTKEVRETLLTNFFKHEVVANNNLKDFFGAGVFYMGCFRSQLRDNPDEKAATVQLKNILEMRRMLLEFLIKKTTFYNIHRDPTEQNSGQPSSICRTS